MQFEWDDSKAERNARKHRVSFDEALSAFYDPRQVAFYDPEHSEDEDREILIGHSGQARLLVVIYTLRGETIRIISARLATRKETEDYARGV
jgi:hypothetical protein